jgi:CBS domain-containing protein
MPAHLIRDVMTPSPVCLDLTAETREAAELMAEEGIGDVIVCDHDHIVGIVTDRDIAIRLVAQGLDDSTPLREIASTDLTFLTPDDPVEDAVALMRTRALRRLPVVDGDRPVGIVSIGDLALDLDPDSALADISAAPAGM